MGVKKWHSIDDEASVFRAENILASGMGLAWYFSSLAIFELAN
jgi:hypothetical protein